MKYMRYVIRNARRNPVRSLLTVASTGISLFLMMILLSFFQVNDDVAASTRSFNRIFVLNSQGFAGLVPIVRVREISEMNGVVAASPMSWFGGKYGEEVMPFAQFGVDADTFFTVYNELVVPPDQLKAFQENRDGCVIGKKMAEERKLKVGDPLPLKGNIYPVDLKLTIRGIYDGPSNRDLRMCIFHWNYVDELLKVSSKAASGNAGAIVARLKNGDQLPALCKAIDTNYLNTDNPTRSQSEEAFSRFFMEMLGDLKGMVTAIGIAVVFSLLLVCANALAMALRERTTEVAVLKAIGFGRQLVLFLVLAEAMMVAGLGGVCGALGCKLLCDVVDLSKFTGGFLPFFFVSWSTALLGLAVAILIGFFSGLFPAFRASRLSVIDGLRKVV
ncbi:MAG: FtsX-like permease family protein [Isosphaeraceae bacterium]